MGLCVAFVFLQVVTSTSNVPRSGSRHSQPGKNLHPNARVFGKYGPEPCFFCFDERQRTMLVFSHMEYAKKTLPPGSSSPRAASVSWSACSHCWKRWVLQMRAAAQLCAQLVPRCLPSWLPRCPGSTARRRPELRAGLWGSITCTFRRHTHVYDPLIYFYYCFPP